MFNAGTLNIDIRANLALLERDMNRVSGTLRRAGRNFSTIGDAITKTISLPVVAAVGAAVKSATSFESAFAGVRKTVNASEAEFSRLRQGIRDLAKEMPNSATEIARVAEAAGQLGIKNENLMAFTKTMVELGTATNLSSEQAANALARFVNRAGLAQDQFQNIGAAIVALGNESNATESEIVEMSVRIATAGRLAKINASDMLALATTMAGLGIEAEMGGTAITKTIADISKATAQGGPQLVNFAKIAGMSSQQFVQAWEQNAMGALMAFFSGLDNMAGKGQNLFLVLDKLGITETRQAQAILSLAGAHEQLAGMLSLSARDYKSGAALQKEVTERNKTLAAQLLILKNNLIDIGITLGDRLLPGLKDWTSELKDLTQSLQKVDPEVLKQITKWSLWVSVLGFVGLYLGKVMTGLGAIVQVLRNCTFILKPFLVAWNMLASAFETFRVWLVLATDFELTFTAVFAKVSSAVTSFWGTLTASGPIVSSVIASLVTLTGALTGLSVGALAAGGDFSLFAKGMGEAASTIGSKISNALSAWANEIGNITVSIYNSVISTLAGFEELVLSTFQQLGIDIPGFIARMVNDCIKEFNRLVEVVTGIKDLLGQAFTNLQADFRSGIGVLGESLNAPSWVEWAKSSQAAADQIATPIRTAQQATEDFLGTMFKIPGAYDEQMSKVVECTAATGDLTTAQNTFGKAGQSEVPKVNDLLDTTKEKADKAADAVKGLAEKFSSMQSNRAVDSIKEQIDKLAEAGSSASFGSLFGDYRTQIAEAEFAGVQDALKEASPERIEEAKKVANEIADLETQIYQDEVLKKQLEADKAMHQKSVDFWTGLMEDAISGTRFDFEEQFKKAAVQIAGEFITNLFEANLAGANSFGSLFDTVIGSFTNAINAWGGTALSQMGINVGSSAAGGASSSLVAGTAAGVGAGSASYWGSMVGGATGEYMPGALGSAGGSASTYGTAAGYYSAGSMLTTAAGAVGAGYALYDSYSNWGDAGYEGKGHALGATAGTGIGYVIGGSLGAAVGAWIGKYIGGYIGGLFSEGENPDSMARKAAAATFESKLQELMDAGTPLQLYNSSGNLQTASLDFDIGSASQFMPGENGVTWVDRFWEEYGDKGISTFDALGNALRVNLGIEEDIGGQLGYLLAQNLGTGSDVYQNLDNMRRFLDAMGLTVEQLTESLFNAGKAGQISWHEFEVYRQELLKIPTEGLAAFGAVGQAFQQVLESGGTGIEALTGLQYMAVEASEAGITSLEGLRLSLQNAGYDTQTLDILFAAFAARGITSIEALGSASDYTFAGIIADMESGGLQWNQWAVAAETMTGAVDQLTEAINKLSNSINSLPSTKTIDIETNVDSGLAAAKNGLITGFANGGIFNTKSYFRLPSGRLGMLGEAGPEAVMPLGRVNGKLGVMASGFGGSAQGAIYIDARYAEAGVEHRILNAVGNLKQSIINDVMASMGASNRRGVY